MIELREFTPSQLREYIDSEEFAQSPVIPISRHRALSHIANPRVDPDDVILVLAYSDQRMVGYLGVFADRIHFEGQAEKAGWLSCMWVDPETRGQGIAKKLLQRVFECWDDRILVTEFTPAAKGLYDRSGKFVDLIQKRGVRGYLRFHIHELLPKRNPAWAPWRPVLWVMDWVSNVAHDLLLAWWKVEPGVDWERVREIDHETDQFIQQHLVYNFTRRTGEDLNWMIQNPWVISGPGPDRDSGRYHFTAVEKRFEFHAIKMFKPGTRDLVGLLILSIRDGKLKVPYWFVDNNYHTQGALLVLQYLLQYRMNSVTLFHPQACAALNSIQAPFILKRTLYRNYIISKKFEQAVTDADLIRMQDGDADNAFT